MASRVLPTAKGIPILGTLPALLAAGGAPKLHEYVDKRHKELGPIFKDKIGPVSAVFISSAEYMRKIFGAEGKSPRHVIPESWTLYNQIYRQQRGLLFMDGEEWVKYRKLMNGVFLKPNSQTLIPAVSYVADRLVEKWQTGEEIHNLEETLYKWSLETILSILLGAESYASQQRDLDPLVTELSGDLHKIFVESANLSLLPAKLAMHMNLPQWKRFVKVAQNTFKTATQLMSRLDSYEPTSNGLHKQLIQTGMHKEDLHRVTIDLIMAAGDTTAYTTQWLLYLLGKNPDVQHRLYKETIGLTDGETVENQYLKGCLRETLRLYPVAPFVTRYLPQPLQLDGYELEKDTLIIMSLYTSGRDTKCFPDASIFKPERWIRDGRDYQGVLNPYGSLPFAMGVRSCIGRKIAEVQIGLATKKLINTAVVEVQNKENVEIKLQLITTPSPTIIVRFKHRPIG